MRKLAPDETTKHDTRSITKKLVRISSAIGLQSHQQSHLHKRRDMAMMLELLVWVNELAAKERKNVAKVWLGALPQKGLAVHSSRERCPQTQRLHQSHTKC
jgi:hypothetical protein